MTGDYRILALPLPASSAIVNAVKMHSALYRPFLPPAHNYFSREPPLVASRRERRAGRDGEPPIERPFFIFASGGRWKEFGGERVKERRRDRGMRDRFERERERCIAFKGGGSGRGAAIRAETSVADECAVSHAAFRPRLFFLSPQ